MRADDRPRSSLRKELNMRIATLGVLLTFAFAHSDLAQESRAGGDRAALARRAQEAIQSENWDEAVTQLRALLKIDPKDGRAWGDLGYALHISGKLDEALEAHLKAAEFPRSKTRGLYNAGCAYALKKDKDKAFEYLMKAADAGFNDSQNLAGDTDLTDLHDDPRWAKVVEAIKNAKPSAASAFSFAQPGDRRGTRVAWIAGSATLGEIAIGYGAVTWKDGYGEKAKSKEFENKRWRLGKDFWTTLDSNIPVTIGTTAVPPGYYYLTLEKKSSGDFVLALNDAAAVKKGRFDAFQAESTQGGIEVVLKHETTPESASKLDIALTLAQDDPAKGALTIRFGPNKLSAPVAYQLAEK
jgi:Tetratricopeptide repeat